MKTKILLFGIILLSFLLRTWKIDQFPSTLYGDEQAFAWNAYNILKLGQDEYGNPYPLQFKSFDDYKAPIPVYLLVPFIKLLDLTPFAIRLPISIASTLTVIIAYLLARLFFNKKISLIIVFLMAISSWHMHLSRGFFEATLALLWFTLGIYFFLKSKNNIKFVVLSILFFGLSLYSYFVPRILVPVFLLFLTWHIARFTQFLHPGGVVKRHPWGGFKAFLLSFVFLILLSLPLIKLTIFDQGFSRFNKLTESNTRVVVEAVNKERFASNLPQNWKVIFHNKAIVWLRLIKNNFLEHISPNFWYVYGDNSLRYFTGNMGMFHLIEFPFLIAGLYYLWRDKRSTALFFLGWILLAALPASLVGRPFAVRSLSMLPAPFIFVGYGLYKFLRLVSGSSTPGESFRATPGMSLRQYLFSSIIAFIFVVSLGSLLVRYYLEYPVYAATWWGWENKAALDYAKVQESQYDKIFISDFYTGATLAYAVYNQYNPFEYRKALGNPVVLADGRTLTKLGKYYFGSLDIDKKRLEQNIIPPKSLYIARPEEADSDQTINAPDDGRVIFKIYKTK